MEDQNTNVVTEEVGTEVPEVVAQELSEDEQIAAMLREDEEAGAQGPEPETEQEETEGPAGGPEEQVPAGAVEDVSETVSVPADQLAAVLKRIDELTAKLSATTMRAARAVRKVEAKANRTYKILSLVPTGDWNPPPQVDAIATILAPLVGKEIKEPALFEAIRQGHAAGTLDTIQDPVHIFRYYRKDMKESGMLEVRG